MIMHSSYFHRDRESGRFLPFFIVSVVILVGLMVSLRFYFFSGLLRPSVFLSNISLKGLSKADITRIVGDLSSRLMQGQVLLKCSKGSWMFSPSELGIKTPGQALVEKIWIYGNGPSLWLRVRNWWRTMRSPRTVPLSVNVDQAVIKSVFSLIAGKIETLAEPASLFSFDDGSLKIIRGRPGMKMDRKRTLDGIKEIFQNDPFIFQKEVDIILAQVDVRPDFGSFQKKSGLTVELASFSTRYDTIKELRAVNLRLAAEAIDGWIVAPGEEFSFNEAVGPRTSKRGFKPAASIINGRLVADTGGGICQVTTTLYNSVLLVHLDIVERYPHSMYFKDTAYVPQGRDAAVVWGHKDFVFHNNLDQSILISAYAREGTVNVTLYGAKPTGVIVELWQEKLRVLTAKTVTRIDPKIPPGTVKEETPGVDGYSVMVMRKVIRPEGKEEQGIVSRDIYRSTPRIIYVAGDESGR